MSTGSSSSSSNPTGVDNTKETNPETPSNRYPERPSDIQGSVELPAVKSPLRVELPTASSPCELPTVNYPR